MVSKGLVLHEGKPGFTADEVSSSMAHKIKDHFEGSHVGLSLRGGVFYVTLSNGQTFEVQVTEIEKKG